MSDGGVPPPPPLPEEDDESAAALLVGDRREKANTAEPSATPPTDNANAAPESSLPEPATEPLPKDLTDDKTETPAHSELESEPNQVSQEEPNLQEVADKTDMVSPPVESAEEGGCHSFAQREASASHQEPDGPPPEVPVVSAEAVGDNNAENI